MASKPTKTRRWAQRRRTQSPRHNRSRIYPDLQKLSQASTALFKSAQAALRESKKRLEATIESSRDAIVLINPKGKITQVNTALEDLFGYSRNEVIGRPITILFPEGLSASQSLFSTLSAKDWKVYRDVHACRKDGLRVQIQIRLAPIRTPQNRVVLVSISEITSRSLKVEQALRDSDERLRLALFSTNVAIWEWDVTTNQLTWSPTGTNILGIDPTSVRHYENFVERIHRDDLVRFEAERDKAVRNHESFVLEFRIIRLSGEIRWVSASGRAYYDRTGQPIRVLGTIRDVTDRYRADANLRQSEARFRNIFEHAAMGIAITDLEGRFQQCNPAYCTLLGYSREELHHMYKIDLIHPEDRAANLRQIRRLKERQIPFFEIEDRYIRKDGGVAWVRKFISVLPDSTGKPAYLMALVTDVTDRRRVEEALQRNQEELRLRKDQLQELTTKLLTAQDEERRRIARELHDDFSQRIAALVLEVGALEQHPPVLPKLLPQALEPVRIELEQLADDIHDLAYKLHPTLLNDAGLQAAIEDHIRKISQRTGLRIALKTRHVPQTIPLDLSTCLFRVFQESLQNIVKHANASEVVIRLNGGPTGIGLSVMDNGIGFDAFDKSSHHKGLGLVSMQERLRFLNGFLRIHSRPADGTKVCAWIPSGEVSHDASSRSDGG